MGFASWKKKKKKEEEEEEDGVGWIYVCHLPQECYEDSELNRKTEFFSAHQWWEIFHRMWRLLLQRGRILVSLRPPQAPNATTATTPSA
jgi:hypothetical protein